MRSTRSRRPAPALDGRAVAVGLAVLATALLDPPASLLLYGVSNGALYGLAAAGVVVVFRVQGAINFAAVAIGALPAVIAMLLVVAHGLPYWAALVISLAGGGLVGAAVELVVIRRFADGSRLLITVATLAVVQVLSLIGEPVAARVLTDRDVPATVPSPWRSVEWVDGRGIPIVTGDEIAAVVMVVVVGVTLALASRHSRTGIALRAVGENVIRAPLLGLPVQRLHTLAWAVAGFLAAATVFFRVPLTGVPVDPTLGVDVTLFVIAAATVSRFDSIPVALAAGVVIGVLEQGAISRAGSANLASALVLTLLVVTLGLQRRSEARVLEADDAAWRGVVEPLPIPAALRRLPAVRAGRITVALAVAFVAAAAPFVVSAGQLGKLTLIPLTALIGVSLVVLTGWAGQVSLGQYAFAGVGAGVAGGLAANHQVDFLVALVAGVAAGAVAAVLVGFPAARVRGVYLAVTTLALAAAMESYVLEEGSPFHRWILPRGEAPRVERPVLVGAIDLADDRSFYFLSVACLLLGASSARSFRRGRSGRLVLAARDNRRAAVTLGVNPVAARMAAYALAGGLAGLAGALLAYQQGGVDAGTFGAAPSIALFLAVVFGGITSPTGAVLGATVLKAVQFFLEPHFDDAAILFDGPLLLLVLLINPGGLSAGLVGLRDRWLRVVAKQQPAPDPADGANTNRLLTADARR